MRRIAGAFAAALLCAMWVAPARVVAEGFWLPAGDARLRSDVTLLADEGVLRLPVMAWPIPADDLTRGLARVDVESIREPALRAALLRVRARMTTGRDESQGTQTATVGGGRAALLRDYDEPGREDGEISWRSSATTGPWSANLAVTAALSPQDDRALRFDGSDLSYRLGNWIFSANTLERWWGPAHSGSLILSNNARPMPGVSLDRVRSAPFSIPIISWLGPWRFSALLALMDNSRADVQAPLFMAMRVSFQPLPFLEAGLSRSAQFCGKGRACGLKTFARVIAGRDNAGIRVAPEDEPGNQMAGADLRLTSPIQVLPVAAYVQLIGEDSSSSGIPERYLGLFGFESWWLLENGSSLRAHVEYSDTVCKFDRTDPRVDCAYRQSIFYAGYRYRGRNVGHTTDGDSLLRALGVSWVRGNGDEWALAARGASLDRFGRPDPFNRLTAGRSEYRSVGGTWRGRRWNLDLRAQLGIEEQRAADADAARRAFGYLSITRTF